MGAKAVRPALAETSQVLKPFRNSRFPGLQVTLRQAFGISDEFGMTRRNAETSFPLGPSPGFGLPVGALQQTLPLVAASWGPAPGICRRGWLLEASSHREPRFWWRPAGALRVQLREEMVQVYDGLENEEEC